VYENGLYLPNGNFHRENVCRGENYDQPMDWGVSNFKTNPNELAERSVENSWIVFERLLLPKVAEPQVAEPPQFFLAYGKFYRKPLHFRVMS
jgi:hypothetical protein